MPSPLAALRNRIANQVRGLTRATGGLSLDIDSPPGDPGLFGPDAVCWQVHADFPAMMAGGISALLLQALHPRALAGVWDHSNFREDLQGRLGRTAQFVAGTTYGSRRDALALIGHVKSIHNRVQGIAPDTDHRAGRIAALACAHDRTDDGPVRRLSSRHPVERPALLVQAQPPTAPASA